MLNSNKDLKPSENASKFPDTQYSYKKRLDEVRKLVDENPKLVAQLVKMWIKDDVK